MKKSTLYSLMAATGIFAALPGVASAAITGLNVDSAVNGCIAGAGTYPSCTYGATITGGSYFSMDTNKDGIVQPAEKTGITALNTLNLGDTSVAYSGQVYVPATATKPSIPSAPAIPGWDTWSFYGAAGVDYLTSAMVDNGDGTINMSGWTVSWNGLAAIPMGGDAAQGDTSLATITCGAPGCTGVGDTFILDYSAHVPLGDPSNFGGIQYKLHLEGHIASVSQVPVPAAAWLFGSGLLGLVGVARRKKAQA